jgi:hypothetical protein
LAAPLDDQLAQGLSTVLQSAVHVPYRPRPDPSGFIAVQ